MWWHTQNNRNMHNNDSTIKLFHYFSSNIHTSPTHLSWQESLVEGAGWWSHAAWQSGHWRWPWGQWWVSPARQGTGGDTHSTTVSLWTWRGRREKGGGMQNAHFDLKRALSNEHWRVSFFGVILLDFAGKLHGTPNVPAVQVELWVEVLLGCDVCGVVRTGTLGHITLTEIQREREREW